MDAVRFFLPCRLRSLIKRVFQRMRKIADALLVETWLPYSLFLNHFCSAASIWCIDSVENT